MFVIHKHKYVICVCDTQICGPKINVSFCRNLTRDSVDCGEGQTRAGATRNSQLATPNSQLLQPLKIYSLVYSYPTDNNNHQLRRRCAFCIALSSCILPIIGNVKIRQARGGSTPATGSTSSGAFLSRSAVEDIEKFHDVP